MNQAGGLEIPDEAWGAVVAAVPIEAVVAAKGSAWDINELQERAVKAAAPLIVAAELRRIAEIYGSVTAGFLEGRASELEAVA